MVVKTSITLNSLEYRFTYILVLLFWSKANDDDASTQHAWAKTRHNHARRTCKPKFEELTKM